MSILIPNQTHRSLQSPQVHDRGIVMQLIHVLILYVNLTLAVIVVLGISYLHVALFIYSLIFWTRSSHLPAITMASVLSALSKAFHIDAT